MDIQATTIKVCEEKKGIILAKRAEMDNYSEGIVDDTLYFLEAINWLVRCGEDPRTCYLLLRSGEIMIQGMSCAIKGIKYCSEIIQIPEYNVPRCTSKLEYIMDHQLISFKYWAGTLSKICATIRTTLKNNESTGSPQEKAGMVVNGLFKVLREASVYDE